jgi:hypothetical protein
MLIMVVVLLIIIGLAVFILVIPILALLMTVAIIVVALQMARHCGRSLEDLGVSVQEDGDKLFSKGAAW